MGDVIQFKSGRQGAYSYPICGAMGEGMGMGMGGNVGMSCPPPPPPPSPPPPAPPPAAIPNLDSRPAGALPGSVYVSGTELFYVSSFGGLFKGTGQDSGSSPAGAIVGSVYVDGDVWQYIDAVGRLRNLHASSLGAKDGAAIHGSTWVDSARVEGKQFAWVSGTTLFQWWNGQ